MKSINNVHPYTGTFSTSSYDFRSIKIIEYIAKFKVNKKGWDSAAVHRLHVKFKSSKQRYVY